MAVLSLLLYLAGLCVVVAIAIAILRGLYGAASGGQNFLRFVILGIILGPVGLILAIYLDKRDADAQARARHAAARAPCPMCREPVLKGAKICPHCRSPLTWPRQPKLRLVRRKHPPA